jgi:nicotinamide phosphoribosyltransferase
MRANNLLCLTDSYKISHWRQYPPNTSLIYSYFESRGGQFKDVVFFGLQYLLKEYLEGQAFNLNDISEAEELYNQHFGKSDTFNKESWLRLYNKYGGKLPVRITAVPEGTPVEYKNVLMTIENTDPEFYWLTNYLETLLVQTWYGSTVATQSREIKKLINKFLESTGSSASLDFKLHDFGFRGVSSVESAAIGGAAHLINFKGTDTIESLRFARDYYNAKSVAGFSIPATEHSTIMLWGREGEVDAYRNHLNQFKDYDVVACVSDTYDIFNACQNIWGTELHDEIINRGKTLVVRPDSGDPTTVVLKVVEILAKKFGSTVNEKGFRVLNPLIRVIQGDGVEYNTINAIYTNLKENGWAAENVGFGMGGALLQKLNRDTQKFAFKCSFGIVDGVSKNVFKNPITDSTKKSKSGRLALSKSMYSEWGTYQEGYRYADNTGKMVTVKNLLVPVFENGSILTEYTFDEIRLNAKI